MYVHNSTWLHSSGSARASRIGQRWTVQAIAEIYQILPIPTTNQPLRVPPNSHSPSSPLSQKGTLHMG